MKLRLLKVMFIVVCRKYSVYHAFNFQNILDQKEEDKENVINNLVDKNEEIWKYISIKEEVKFEDLYQMGYISLGKLLHFFPQSSEIINELRSEPIYHRNYRFVTWCRNLPRSGRNRLLHATNMNCESSPRKPHSNEGTEDIARHCQINCEDMIQK